MRKIPTKNYFILFLVTIGTILIVTYLVNLYKSKQDYNDEVNHRMSFLREIKADDFENYITENPETIVYLSNSSDDSLKNVEIKLKKKLQQQEYVNQVVYLNLKNAPVNLLEIFKNNFSDTLKLNEYNSIPNLIIIENSKISKIMYIDDNTNVNRILNFIEINYD